MKLVLKLSALFLVFLITSCNTNPPNSPIIPDTGKIAVTSNIAGAKIFLDNIYTGKLTPDTISATVGNHLIALEKDNYALSSIQVKVIKDSTITATVNLTEAEAPKIVLVEDFANVSCNPCVVSNKILHSLNLYAYGPTKIITIKFPTNFPGPNDPFYLVNKPNSDARKTLYSINSAPTLVVDGIVKPAPSDSTKIKEAINTRLALNGRFVITIKDSIAGGNTYNTITIKPVNTAGLDFANLVLHTVLVEKEISFATPPGSNGETVFYDVVRAMSPDANGQALTTNNQTTTVNYTGQFSLTGYNPANMEIVAFIQDKTTKQVYQVSAKKLN